MTSLMVSAREIVAGCALLRSVWTGLWRCCDAGSRKRSTTGWSREHTDVTQDSFDLLKVWRRCS